MEDDHACGKRFSLVYLKSDRLIPDSIRLRRRLIAVFEGEIGHNSGEVGRILQGELGISVLTFNYGSYFVTWSDILRWEMRDVLDAITLIGRTFDGNEGKYSRFKREISRIFAEESASYRLDEKCGVHPAIDAAYLANFDSMIRHLGSKRFESARTHVAKADDELLPAGNSREAIRAIFDAVENLYKQIFPKAQSINSAGIKNDLKPFAQRFYLDGPEARAVSKNVDALSDWVEACHNYRHDPGHPDPTPPSEELAVLIVSQGIGYVRWLADLLSKG